MAIKRESAVKNVKFPKPSSTGGYSGYINAIYDAEEKARSADIEAAYSKAASDLAQAQAAAAARYAEADKTAAQNLKAQQGAFGASAGARGLDTGHGSQAAMMMQNASMANAGARAMVKAQTDAQYAMERENLTGSYAAQREKAIAENEYNRNKALYENAVRADEVRRQQAQLRREQNLAELKAELNARQDAAKAKKGTGGYVSTKLSLPREEDIDFTGYSPSTAYAMAAQMIEDYALPLASFMTPEQQAGDSAMRSAGDRMDYTAYLNAIVRNAVREKGKETEIDSDAIAALVNSFST